MHIQKHVRVLLASTSLLALVVPSTAASDLCGATIVANLTLNEDLVCAAGGLIIGADGIKLDLNGHAITGPGNVTIVGGTVRNFATA